MALLLSATSLAGCRTLLEPKEGSARGRAPQVIAPAQPKTLLLGVPLLGAELASAAEALPPAAAGAGPRLEHLCGPDPREGDARRTKRRADGLRIVG